MTRQLTSIAATLGQATKTAARDALRAAGMPISANIDALIAERERLQSLRRTARARRLIRSLGYAPITPARASTGWGCDTPHAVADAPPNLPYHWREPAHGTQAPRRAALPSGTPAQRLDSLRRRVIRDEIRSGLRIGANDTLSVALTDDPAAVCVCQVEGTDYSVYRGAFKGWACRYRAWTVTAPAQWRVRVQRRGLAWLGGLFTLDAAPLDGAPDGVELFAAVWVERGRGNAVRTARGCVARSGAQSYHADTPAAALQGLRRKLRAAAWDATLRTADLSALVAGHAAHVVRVADARAIGACEYGIRSWCAAVGLDYATGAATLAEVYAGYQMRPQPQARAAILHALRRVRSA